jgi:type IV pilus assembly protein PilF
MVFRGKVLTGACSFLMLFELAACGLIKPSAQEPLQQARQENNDLNYVTPSESEQKVKRAEARVQLGSAYLADGNARVALDEARKAVEIDPNSANGYSLLALSYKVLGDKESARQAFVKAIKLAPDDADIASNYGVFLCETGNAQRGIDTILKGLSTPLYPRKAKLLQMAAICAENVNQLKQAEQYYKQSFDYDVNNTFSTLQLFENYLKQNRLNDARVLLSNLKAQNDVNPQWLFLTARLENKAGAKEAAQKAIASLMERFPDSAEATKVRQGMKNER